LKAVAVGVGSLFLALTLSSAVYAGSAPSGDGISVSRAIPLLSTTEHFFDLRDGSPQFSEVFGPELGSDQIEFVAGDWDGDGVKSLGYVEEGPGSTARWVLDWDGTGTDMRWVLFGPFVLTTFVPADWDPQSPGDELGFTRQAGGGSTALAWTTQLGALTGGTGPKMMRVANQSTRWYGNSNDLPVPGDWRTGVDGDEPAVVRLAGDASSILWLYPGVGNNSTGAWFGNFNSHTPAPGDWTGDGATDYGVKLNSAAWALNQDFNDLSDVSYSFLGDAGDTPAIRPGIGNYPGSSAP